MSTKDFFLGRYTLNPNIILRRSYFNYTIYDIRTDLASEINFFFYTILNFFLHNATNLEEIGRYLTNNKIIYDLNSVQNLINSRQDYADLLIEADQPFKVSNPYNDFRINQLYEHTPENIDLLITNKCNLHCPHCYRNSTNRDLLKKIPLQRFFKILDEMEEMRVRSLKITGGEAFLVKELYDIVEYASRKRIHISILSNGTISLDEKWLTLLAKENITLGISLDGTKAETNDKIRGEGSFEKTINNLKKVMKNKVKFSLTFTINIHNYNEIENIIELAVNLRAQKLNFNFIEESGRALDNKILYTDKKLDTSSIKSYILQLKEKYRNYPITLRIADNHGIATDEDDIRLIKDKKDLIICKAGFYGLAIDASLKVYPCIYGIGGKKEFSVGSLLRRNLADVWNDSILNLFRGGIKIQDLPKCRECDKKDLCNLKYCRLRPIYEGDSLYDVVPFCAREMENKNLNNSEA